MDAEVVVGTDGSHTAEGAVRWAAAEAGRRGAALCVIHAWVWPLLKVGLGPAPGAPAGAGLQAQADRTLADASAAAVEACPGLRVTTSLLVGDAATRLVSASRDAEMLVVGNRGLGGFAGLLLGSVSTSVAAHATCPTVVVRGTPDPEGPVVVGVDDEGSSADAIEAAFATAHRNGAEVLAVHAYRTPAPAGEQELAARHLVDTEVAKARSTFPGVAMSIRLGTHSPARELVAASEGAQLVVVGARGSGLLTSTLIGTTSAALIHHSHSPVLVQR